MTAGGETDALRDFGYAVPVSYTHLDVYKRQTQEMPKYGIPSIRYLDGATGVNLMQYMGELVGLKMAVESEETPEAAPAEEKQPSGQETKDDASNKAQFTAFMEAADALKQMGVKALRVNPRQSTDLPDFLQAFRNCGKAQPVKTGVIFNVNDGCFFLLSGQPA